MQSEIHHSNACMPNLVPPICMQTFKKKISKHDADILNILAVLYECNIFEKPKHFPSKFSHTLIE